MAEITREEAPEYFRNLLNKHIHKGRYYRKEGIVSDSEPLTGIDMILLADTLGLYSVFYPRHKHWIYIVDMDENNSKAYDPMYGIIDIKTLDVSCSEIHMSNNLEILYGQIIYTPPEPNITRKQFLINHYFPDNRPPDEVIQYLKDLGRIQYDSYNCGPMCIYAALAAKQFYENNLTIEQDTLTIGPYKDELEFL